MSSRAAESGAVLADELAERPNENQADMRILVVEDDKKIASFVANGLKQSGYAVDQCLSGDEGLLMARSVPYDVAVIDVMLPRLDGLTLIQTLRKENIRTPVLIL